MTGSGASRCSPTTRSSSRSSSTRCASTRRARATRSSGRSTWASGSRRERSPRSCAREWPAPTDPGQLAALAALVLAAAVLYSSVGHAGASAYLAAMGLFGVAPAAMRPAALAMNVVVATAGTWRFASAGAVPWRLLAPLCAASVPAAFVGGAIQLPAKLYAPLLALTLVFAAWRLWSQLERADLRPAPGARVLLAIGGGFGLLAGLTGIGGGIFLSPTLVLPRRGAPPPAAGAGGG